MRGVLFAALLAGCPRAAAPDSACAIVIRGACVDAAAAQKYCGPAAHWAGACVLDACPSGQIRDEVSGECLGARSLHAIAERQHVGLDEETRPSCREGLVLRVAAGRARCDAPPAALPRDTCAAGSAWSGDACVALRARGVVDAGAWARTVLGADGGSGSPWLCARVGIDPTAYGLVSGAEGALIIDVELVAPDNDVTLARARTRATELTASGIPRPMPATGEALVVRAVEAEVELFRALGGTSSSAALTTRVRCPIRAGTAPQGT
jgi:hypothetical protein